MRRQIIEWTLTAAVAMTTAVALGAGAAGGGGGGGMGGGGAVPHSTPAAPPGSFNVMNAPTPQGVFSQPTPPGVFSTPTPNVQNTNTVIRSTMPMIMRNPNGVGVIFTGGGFFDGAQVIGGPGGGGEIMSGNLPAYGQGDSSILKGETPPSAVGGGGTTANVPPPEAFRNPPSVNPPSAVVTTADRPAEIEGQLVDSYSASTTPPSGVTVTSDTPRVSGSGATSPAPGLDVQNISAGMKTTPNAVGQVASVNTTGASDSFGTYERPGVVRSTSGSLDTNKTIRTSDGTTSTTTTVTIDPEASSRQLKNGVPAAVMVGGQMYLLLCDGRQLAQYAGQHVRVSGRLTSTGMLIPDRLDVQLLTGDYREVAPSLPGDAGSKTATERP